MMPSAPVTEAGATDTILLTFPSRASYRGIPTLVLSGIGSRLELPFERMDDLQLAVLSMLDASAGADTSVEIQAQSDRVAVSVGPLRAEAGDDRGLGLVLERLTDGVEPARRNDGAWLTVFLERSPAGSPDAPAG